MAEYNPNRASLWNYGGEKWKLSRSKIDLFIECPRCFYIDNKLGTKRVGLPAFLLNSAVDHQLKQEFDVHRANKTKHPLQKEYKIDATPAQNENIDEWRENFKGVQFFHKPTGMTISGAIDDLWVNSKGEHIIVDYKATAKDNPILELDSESKYHNAYKRQMEVYQWLVRKNDLKVSNTGYFVYCTGRRDQKAFDKLIEFDIKLIPYTGDDQWVEPTILEIKKCLEKNTIPKQGSACELCAWFYARGSHEKIL
jgi:hypothetical protein